MNAQQALGWALIHFVWQGTLLGLLAAALFALLRKPQSRYAAGCAVMSLMAGSPVITFFWLSSGRVVMDVDLPAVSANTAAAAVRSAWNPDWLQVLTQVWMAGATLLLLRSVGGWCLAWRRSRAGQGALLFVREGVRIYESAMVRVPQVFGWLRPVVLVPVCALMGLTPEQLESLIAHELAHVRRYDYLVNLLQTVVENLLFYHPAVWWVSSRMRKYREECCDEAAVEACGDRVLYSTALLRLEEVRVEFSMAAAGSGVKERIGRLLGMEQKRYGMAPALSVSAVAVILGGMLWAQSDAPKAPSPPPPPPAKKGVKPPPPPPPPTVDQEKKMPPPPPPPPPPGKGVAGGTEGGISGGVAGGVAGGMVAVEKEMRRAHEAMEAKEIQLRRLSEELQREGMKLRSEADAMKPQMEALRAELEKIGGDEAIRKKISAELEMKAKVMEDASRRIDEQMKALDSQMKEMAARETKELAIHDKRLLEPAQAQDRVNQIRAEMAAKLAQKEALAQAQSDGDRSERQAKEKARRQEYERRVEYADKKFAEAGKRGSETDRGKVYLKNGPPDEIEVHPERKSESWRYRGGSTYEFVEGKLKMFGAVI